MVKNLLTEKRDSFVRPCIFVKHRRSKLLQGFLLTSIVFFNCCVVSITCHSIQHRSVPAPWHKNWNLTALFFSNAGQIALGIPTYQRRLVSYCVVSITCQPVQPRSIPRRLALWHENWNLSVLFFFNFDIALGIPTYQRRLVSSCVVSITYLPIQHRNIRSRVAPLDKNC